MTIICGMADHLLLLRPNTLSLANFRGDLSEGLNELPRRFAAIGDYRVLIIGLLDVPRVAGSAALALGEVIQRAADERKHVIIVGMTFPVARLLGHLGILDRVRESELFDSRSEAVRSAVSFLARGEATA